MKSATYFLLSLGILVLEFFLDRHGMYHVRRNHAA